jgi:diguanylate cyclase (GGDEF)-like protein
MNQTNLQTIAGVERLHHAPSVQSEGCLLRIHPMDLNTGLLLFESSTYLIGREDFCDLTVNQDAVSRRHCKIDRKGGGEFILTDLNSTNGTFLNEKRVGQTPHPIYAGDTIRVGSQVYKFLTTDHIEAHHYEAAYSMMTTDSLTGVLNKRYFSDMLNRELRRSARSNTPLTTLMLDLDDFKQINDNYGHLVGDDVLRGFAKRVSGLLREEDMLARYGGEEFVLMLNETAAEQARVVAERCLEAIRGEPFVCGEVQISCTVSIGGASFSGDPEDITPNQLLRRADLKLYEAKKLGKDKYVS